MSKYKYNFPPIDQQPKNIRALQAETNLPFPTEGFQSTLKIIKLEDLAQGQGNAGIGQVMRSLLGAGSDTPTDGLGLTTATYEAGADEPFHWHMGGGGMLAMIVSGRFIMKDINLKEHELTPGSFIHTPTGLNGAHSWEPKEPNSTILMASRHDLTIGGTGIGQFTLDPKTLKSYLPPQMTQRSMTGRPPIWRVKSRTV